MAKVKAAEQVAGQVEKAAPIDSPPEAAGEVEARALIDLPAHGVQAGRLLVADAAVVEALVAAGEVDPHPDAVAYAKTLSD
jgi:hypothetical protein